MKKFFALSFILIFTFFSCSKADIVAWEKNREASEEGIPRSFSAVSAYTGETVFYRYIENSYFEGGVESGSIDIDILDLETREKISLIASTGFLLIIEEGE